MAKLKRKNKVLEEISNHDRWLVSYADFITLLFAFFVVMYTLVTWGLVVLTKSAHPSEKLGAHA